MSSHNITLPIISDRVDPAEIRRNWLIQLVTKYRPYQGWSTFAILLVMLWILAMSVQSARWTESLNLPEVVFWAALVGLSAMALTMGLPDDLALYVPVFHLTAAWFGVSGIVSLRSGIRLDQ